MIFSITGKFFSFLLRFEMVWSCYLFMIIDYKLTYPSGTATAILINGFHTPKGDKMATYACIFEIPVFQIKSKLIEI